MFLKGTLHIRLHTQIRLHSSRQNFSIRAACEGYFPIKVDFLAMIESAKSNPGETAQLTSAKSEKTLEVIMILLEIVHEMSRSTLNG